MHYIFEFVSMTNKLKLMASQQADCFSFAALSAANENNTFLCDLCGSSAASGEYGGRVGVGDPVVFIRRIPD
jgi:hypothetical protein